VPPSFSSFSQALDEVKNARVFAGIHFGSACDDGQATGTGYSTMRYSGPNEVLARSSEGLAYRTVIWSERVRLKSGKEANGSKSRLHHNRTRRKGT
jgi:hypothetical protein